MSSDIRLRFFSTITAKGRVLETVSIGHTDTIDGTPAVSFTVTKKETALLPEHFIVAVERLVDGAWVEARNGRFVVLDSRTDDASLVQNTSYMGVWLPAHLLQSTYLHWASTAHDGVRTWTSKNVGYILNEMLTESLGRGWGKISGTQFLSWDFDATEDTSGTAWPSTTDDLITQDFPLGMSLWQIVQGFISSGYCEITSQGNVIHLYVPGGVGQDLTGTVTLGPNATSAPVHSSSAGIFTNLTVIPEKARYWVYLENTEADDTFLGRLEATLSLSGVGDDLPVVTRMAQPTLAEGAAARREKQVTYDMAGATFIPGVDYLAGDTVRLKTSSQETLRVVQTVVQKSPSGFTVTAVLGYQFTKLLSRVARGVYGGTGGSVSGGSGQPVQLGTTLAEPKAPTGLAGTPTGVWDASGLPKVNLALSWDAVTQATDDSAIDVAEYDIWSRPSGGVSAPLIQSASSPVTKFGLEPGTLLVKVRVRSVGGVWSEFSAEVSVDLEAPTAVLDAPTDPILTSKLGVVSARWDGDLSTGAPPAQFRFVYLVMATTELGTYSAVGTPMGNAGATPVSDLTKGSTYWFKLIAVDSRGVESAPSAAQSIEVVGVTGPDIVANSITANEVEAGVGTFEKLSLGAVLTPGVTTERVPSQPTDQVFWAKAIDGTYVLVTPPSGYAQQHVTAGSTGVTLDPTSGIARLFLTARHPVPGSRVLNCSYVATGSAPVETNLHTSPKPGQDATGYEVLSSGTGNTFTSQVVETGGQDGLGYWRVTASGVNSSNGTARLGPNFVNGPGTVVTIGMWVRASAACDIRCVIREFTNSDGTGTETTTAAATVTMVAGEWMFFSQTLTLAGTTNSWRPEFRWPTGSTAAARTFDFDDLSAVLGSTAADFTGNDLGAIWTGDRYKSTSTRPTGGIRVVTFDSSDVVTVSEVLPQSQDWAFPTDAVDYTVFIDQPSNGSRLLQAAHVFEAIGQRTGLTNATLTPQGLRVQDDGGSNAVSLGVWDDQLLSINQLNTVGQFVPVASINSDGVVAGTSLETGGDYYINGIPIVGDAESATVNGVPLSVPLLERGPRGEQFSTGLGTDATSFSELALQVVGSTAVQVLGAAKLQLNSGRRYEASIDATLLSRWESAAPTSTSMLWLEMWIGDTAQDSSAPNGVKRRWALLNGADTTYPSLTRIAISPCASFDAPQDADGFSYILVRILRVNSSTSYRVQAWGTSDENNEPTLIIKDVGSSEVDPFVATTKVRTTSGTPSTPGSVVTVQVACSFSQSWGSTASAIYTASSDKFADGRMLHQGQPNRSKMAIFGWPDLSISGKILRKARVLMRARFISMSSGATVQFGTSAYTSPPAISKPAVANRWDDFVPSNSPRWFEIPLDTIPGLALAIASGTVRSLTLGEPTGGSEQTNVIFDGYYPTNAAGTSLVPVFEFTYET